jgi:hypothetical protein
MKPKILVTDATFPEIIDYLSHSFEVEHNQADQDYDESALIQKLKDKAGVFAYPTRRFGAHCLLLALNSRPCAIWLLATTISM